MNRIDRLFSEKRGAGEAALIFYVTAGYPDLATTERVIDALAEGGADLIELGIPFSDPLADGPTIQAASTKALEGGVKVAQILETAKHIRAKHPGLPLLAFSAYNPIFHMGDEAFCKRAAEVGLDGVLIPDLPPEESADLCRQASANELCTVFLTAPTTCAERASMIAEASTGFIYYIAVKGVTGARASLPPDLADKVRAIKARTDKPVAVGFGVSSPEQAGAIAAFADGVIIGSALIRMIGDTPEPAALTERVRAYAKSMREAIAQARVAVGE